MVPSQITYYLLEAVQRFSQGFIEDSLIRLESLFDVIVFILFSKYSTNLVTKSIESSVEDAVI